MMALPQSPDGWAFFLDVDGTLIDIAATPDAVVVPPDLPDTLTRLLERSGGAAALVSGRAITAIDRLVAPAKLPAVGVHGAEIRFADGRRTEIAGSRALDAFRVDIAALAARHPRLIVEDKGGAITVHFRAEPKLADVVEATVRRAVSGDDAWAVQPGKMLIEIRPAGATKGRAIEALMDGPPFRGRRPLAIGDDFTDESMFAVAERLGGLAVRVDTDGRETIASVALDDPRATRAWLKRLIRNQ